MGKLIALAIGVAVFAAAMAILKQLALRRKPTDDGPLPYRARDYLLSKAEQSFYLVLLHVTGTDWRVFPKVRLLDLVWLPRGTPHV